MNYRHIFHAGCRCDVVKHVVLTLVLRHLRAKDKGFAVLDTHAGMGLYDLNDPRAQKTGEADAGIKSLLASAALPDLADYYDVLRKMNPLWSGTGMEGFRVYPGSPLFTYHMLRAQDRLIACELHPDDANALRLQTPDDPRAQTHCRDGYEALGAFLPPPLKRGLALIDPPYEQPDEFEQIVKHISKAYRHWPTGIYMIWYPVKDRPAIWAFHEALATAGIGKILCAEFIYEEEIRTDFLSGSGLIVINPPWKLDEELSALFPALHHAMNTAHQESIVRWVAD
jgi:23S rRNA (adenine2030-N6)-methyltransferase